MALVCHPAFHAFRNKLLGVFLEVTVLASVLHCRNGSHTAVNLIFTSLIQLECSRALIASCEDASHHADISACSDSLGDISGILDSAVGDDRDSIPAGNVIAVHNCCDLRHADTCNHTGGTDGTRSDTYLHSVYACFDQRLGSGSCSHVSGDNLKFRICFLDLADCLQDILGMSVSGIDHDHVYIGFHKRVNTGEYIGCDSHSGSAEQAALSVFCGQRIFDLFLNILDRNQAF